MIVIVEARLSDLLDETNWRSTLNRHIYRGFCSDLPPPKVETETGVSLKNAWENTNHDFLSSSERELLFLLLHDKLPVKERLFRIGQAVDPYCCLEQNIAVVCDVDHLFCSCLRVAELWRRLAYLVRSLLDCKSSDSCLIRLNMNVKRCPLVDRSTCCCSVEQRR